MHCEEDDNLDQTMRWAYDAYLNEKNREVDKLSSPTSARENEEDEEDEEPNEIISDSDSSTGVFQEVIAITPLKSRDVNKREPAKIARQAIKAALDRVVTPPDVADEQFKIFEKSLSNDRDA